MTLTKREIWMLHYLLDFPIIRYMMCNSIGRLDGGEKANVHIKISECLAMFILCDGTERYTPLDVKCVTMDIHDYLASILTNRMDEVIGYPIDRALESGEFYIYAEKFFDVIKNHILDIEKVVNDNLK